MIDNLLENQLKIAKNFLQVISEEYLIWRYKMFILFDDSILNRDHIVSIKKELSLQTSTGKNYLTIFIHMSDGRVFTESGFEERIDEIFEYFKKELIF